MTKLERAKKIIKENIDDARLGIFDFDNFSGGSTVRLNDDADFIVKICYDNEYFEVFGLSDLEFKELEEYYDDLIGDMYRNKYTSKWATDVQKAYKEGYIKGQIDALKKLREDCAGILEEYIPEIIDGRVEELEDESKTL